ncbi:MAG: GTPase ObgE [Oscillospiraceae bacterium]|nr:GTPase ObgE [Oscillospiraceae bacterium]MBR0392157.1 GTPase ObgE [Oscillospiraceae bacterium]
MASFVDQAKIHLHAGKGGDGAVAFHREKYVAAGGPDGGDGGRGGNVVFVVDDNMTTLMDFRYKRKYTAENGADGQGKRSSGRDGEDLFVRVPRGTLIRDTDSGALMHDMSDGEPYIAAKGGRGGWGNIHFATPTRQVPRFAKPGLPGEERDITLELKLLADVGLVGFPNVGKSTLLSVVSKAHPKIANYHFTTLYPNLGIVYADEGKSFVMADIPGMIEGASDGVGLGHDFLRHVERCRLLVHVVDASGSEGRDPVEDYEVICRELRAYGSDLAQKPQIVAANKCDLVDEENEGLKKFLEHVEAEQIPVVSISAATHRGLKPLIDLCLKMLSDLPPAEPFEPDYIEPEAIPETAEDIRILHADGEWQLEGEWLKRVAASVNFSDYESRMYFDRTLRRAGVFDRLESMGVQENDTICIYDLIFDYHF